MARKNREEEQGLGERIGEAVNRTVGAVKKATMSPSPGQDPLYDVLHQEHEEVDRMLSEILSSDDTPRLRELWKTCAVALAVHARAEQDAVYDVLERDQEASIKEAREEHEDIEDLLADADAAMPGTDEFFGFVAELQELVRHHVDEEEGNLLTKARQTVDERERAEMVELFDDLKQRLMPKVQAEFSGRVAEVGAERRERRQQRRTRRTRAA